MEFSNGKVYMTTESFIGKIVTPAEYEIRGNKVIVGGYIFKFLNQNEMETNNIPIMHFKLRKVDK